MSIITNNYTNITKVQFKSKRAEKNDYPTERAPFFTMTDDILDRVYDNYRKSLNEVSFNEIKTVATDVAQETQTPKKDVLKAMQLLTQFANMNDLKLISNAINKENLEYLGNKNQELCFNAIGKGFVSQNTARIASETGVHRSLTYLLDKKKLAPFKHGNDGKIGIILDEEKIQDLEKVKQYQPKEFEDFVNDKKIKFFYISGWDSGISIANRTKDIKQETKNLLSFAKEQNLPLEKAIDYPYIERIKELGIKPTVIKNENDATEFTVYNQMRPEQIRTKNALYNVIEANTLNRFSGCSDVKKAVSNHISAKYLEDTLSVYSIEQMSQDLKQMKKKIDKYAADRNKKIIYAVPNKDVKSSDFIHYCYKKVNNIEPSKFVYMNGLCNYFDKNPERANDTAIVMIDDCALSGNSMRDILAFNADLMMVKGKVPILFANLKCSDEALMNFENTSGHPVDIMSLNKIKAHYIDNDQIEDIIGQPQYRENAYSLAFPYMSPDNNSEFATNIALLHNSRYNSDNFSSDFQRKIYRRNDLAKLSETDRKIYDRKQKARQEYSFCTKNISDDVLDTSAVYAQLIGLSPVRYTDTSAYKITPKELQQIERDIYRDMPYID